MGFLSTNYGPLFWESFVGAIMYWSLFGARGCFRLLGVLGEPMLYDCLNVAGAVRP